MAARAMWKGVIRFGDHRVPVKLYAAVAGRGVHFRLLHRKDHAPVRQAMVNPQTDEVVPFDEVRRAYITAERDVVILDEDDLEALAPEPSRDIELLQLLPPKQIDHRWYLRPYYLGPDDRAETAYGTFTEALGNSGREALVRWVMRGKRYLGALRLEAGYPMLISLRHAEEVVSSETLEPPGGAELSNKELAMAEQLMDMLAGPFEPAEYQDEYRNRVEALIDDKASGKRLRKAPARKARATEDLSGALEKSLAEVRKRA